MTDKPEVTESTATDFILVKDGAGNEFVCRIQDLKNPNSLSDEEKKRCYSNVADAADKP